MRGLAGVDFNVQTSRQGNPMPPRPSWSPAWWETVLYRYPRKVLPPVCLLPLALPPVSEKVGMCVPGGRGSSTSVLPQLV